MRNLSLSLGIFVAALTSGCSFQVGSRAQPNQPAGARPAGPPAAQAPTPAPASTRPVLALGRVKTAPGTTPPATPGTTPPATPATPAAPGAPAGIPLLVGTNVFGQGTPDASGWKGSFFVIPAGTQKLPALATMQPNGVLFAKELNIPVKPMTGGFPGIDANKNEDFAIRWEAPLVVDNEADYTFRILSDDGANVLIDNTLIVENDGVHGAREKSGPVHLVKGTHVVTVDYFQAGGPVTLQLFCKKAGGNETVCPTHLQ